MSSCCISCCCYKFSCISRSDCCRFDEDLRLPTGYSPIDYAYLFAIPMYRDPSVSLESTELTPLSTLLPDVRWLYIFGDWPGRCSVGVRLMLFKTCNCCSSGLSSSLFLCDGCEWLSSWESDLASKSFMLSTYECLDSDLCRFTNGWKADNLWCCDDIETSFSVYLSDYLWLTSCLSGLRNPGAAEDVSLIDLSVFENLLDDPC